ncbi:MAG: YceI family protein [Sulfuricurvum sp.]|uniref:YceI family protein n=1 Tax=Sulfuricurvum sp. TaxID=2025608 RepID=UPI00260407DB|nr:YceI family protein [Sulfuricurvum sp.]MDD2828904.1 YceI family protein [Sulfuricurvum sp.]MDD4948567.1 YceI family protein [Sulfuricurvum sp.]
MNKLAVILAGILVSGSALFAAPYSVDVSHSSVGFKVKHMMISTVSGNFSGFSGSYDLEKGKLKSLSGTVKTTTVDTGIQKRDDHLRSADFFDVATYPEMTFAMTSQKGKKVTGNLTIHGITKAVTMTMDMGGEITDPWGNKRSGFVLNGVVNRKDFGLNWNKAIEAGGVVVGDDVKITIEIEGVAD